MKYKCLFKEGYAAKQEKDFSDIGEVIEATQLWVRFEKVELGNGGPRRFTMSAGNFSVEVTIEETGWS